MWKFAVAGLGLAVIGLDVATGAISGPMRTAADRAPVPVEQQLAAMADTMNRNRGTRQRDNVFLGARVEGLTLVAEYGLAWFPKGGEEAASEKMREKMKGEFCGGRLASAFRQGAAIAFVYKSERTERTLFETRVDFGVCGT